MLFYELIKCFNVFIISISLGSDTHLAEGLLDGLNWLQLQPIFDEITDDIIERLDWAVWGLEVKMKARSFFCRQILCWFSISVFTFWYL